MRWTILCTILRSPRHDFLGILDLTLFIQLHSLVLDDGQYLLWDLRVIRQRDRLGIDRLDLSKGSADSRYAFPSFSLPISAV